MLEQLEQTGIIYDVEIFKNALVVTCYSLKVKQYRIYSWYKDNNNINELLNLITNKNNPRCWIGYNSLQFDNGVMDHLIHNKDITLLKLWEFSQTLIKGNKNPYKYNSNFRNSLDLLEVIREGYNVKSLKAVAVNLKHPTIQDLPVDYDKEITDEEFDVLVDYNKNDVEITLKILNHIEKRLEMRQVLSQHYKIDVLSSADSYIAKKLFDKFYYEKILDKDPNTDIKRLKHLRTLRDVIPIKDIVLPQIKFATPELQSFFYLIKQLDIVRKNDDKFVCDIPELEYGGMTYTVALGGIHSVDTPLIIKTPDDELLLDIDIASQYPTAIINNKVCPAHLDPDIFIPLVEEVVAKRLWYKKHKHENVLYSVLEAGMKIKINTIK